jgi:hypothetical protein
VGVIVVRVLVPGGHVSVDEVEQRVFDRYLHKAKRELIRSIEREWTILLSSLDFAVEIF